VPSHLSRPFLALSCAAALSACSAERGAPASTAPVPVASAVSTASAPAASPSGLPPRDVACASDADCAYDHVYLIDGRCCAGTCSPEAASRRHVSAVEAACARLGWEENRCPMKKCAAPPPLACRAGNCVLVQ
jgi:hypothetical protein